MKQVEWDRLQAEQQEAEQQALERQEAERVEQERLEAEGREREPAQLPPDGQPVDPESAEEFADFDAGAPCDDQAVQRASSYATDRLNRGVYVELFYWTLLGFSEAEMDSRTVADDTLSFARTGTGTKNEVAFRPTSSLRASKNAIPDHLLSWSDFDTAKSNMLAYFKQPTCRWPKSHAEALEVFWYGLCMHPYRNKGVHGERALLIVQSQVRREWHDKLAAKKLDKSVKVFDISVLNEERIRRTYSDVLLRRFEDQPTAAASPSVMVSVNTSEPRQYQDSRTYADDRRTRARDDRRTPRGRDARSRSPTRPPRIAPRRDQGSFQVGAGLSGSYSACAVCLSRESHDVRNCNRTTLWNGKPARVSRTSYNRIANPSGVQLCVAFQTVRGCSSDATSHKHECSGCGRPDHGAQSCPLAQK